LFQGQLTLGAGVEKTIRRREALHTSHQSANQLRADAAAMSPAKVLSVEEYEVAVADLAALAG
jgi:hypothetical protein